MIEKRTFKTRFAKFVIVVILILLALSCILPLMYTLALSLSSKAAAESGLVSFWPVEFTTYAYDEIMKDKAFINSFIISVERVFLALGITLPVLVCAAYPLSKTKEQFVARDFILWLVVFGMVFNVGAIPWYILMIKYGLNNSVFGLAVSGGLPMFHLILMVNFFQRIPNELEEAAMVDGAGPWRILIEIIIPLSKPILATIALFTMVEHWNDFFRGLVLSTSQDHYPLQTYIKQMVFNPEAGTLTTEDLIRMTTLSNKTLNAAKIFISMIPMLCVYPFLQKYFVTGMTLGGVKE